MLPYQVLFLSVSLVSCVGLDIRLRCALFWLILLGFRRYRASQIFFVISFSAVMFIFETISGRLTLVAGYYLLQAGRAMPSIHRVRDRSSCNI